MKNSILLFLIFALACKKPSPIVPPAKDPNIITEENYVQFDLIDLSKGDSCRVTRQFNYSANNSAMQNYWSTNDSIQYEEIIYFHDIENGWIHASTGIYISFYNLLIFNADTLNKNKSKRILFLKNIYNKNELFWKQEMFGMDGIFLQLNDVPRGKDMFSILENNNNYCKLLNVIELDDSNEYTVQIEGEFNVLMRDYYDTSVKYQIKNGRFKLKLGKKDFNTSP